MMDIAIFLSLFQRRPRQIFAPATSAFSRSIGIMQETNIQEKGTVRACGDLKIGP